MVFFKILNSSEASFDELWPQLRDRIVNLSQAVELLGSSFSLSVKTTTGNISSVFIELDMLQDAVGG